MKYKQNKMRNYGMLAGLMIMVVLFVAPTAQGFDMKDNPCAETVNKYCSNVIPGNGRIMKCLREHEADQSLQCKDWIDSTMKKTSDLISVCAQESAKLCSAYGNDTMALVFCLNANYPVLRMDCQAKIREILDRW